MVHAVIEELERDWPTFVIVELSTELDDLIRRLLEVHPLRAADAIPLASCLVLKDRLEEPAVFACWDEPLLRAARAEGLATVPEPAPPQGTIPPLPA